MENLAAFIVVPVNGRLSHGLRGLYKTREEAEKLRLETENQYLSLFSDQEHKPAGGQYRVVKVLLAEIPEDD